MPLNVSRIFPCIFVFCCDIYTLQILSSVFLAYLNLYSCFCYNIFLAHGKNSFAPLYMFPSIFLCIFFSATMPIYTLLIQYHLYIYPVYRFCYNISLAHDKYFFYSLMFAFLHISLYICLCCNIILSRQLNISTQLLFFLHHNPWIFVSVATYHYHKNLFPLNVCFLIYFLAYLCLP